MKTAALPLISLLFLAGYANAQDEQVAQPNAPMPTEIPPAPPAQPPIAEVDSNSQVSAAAQPQPPGTGQWVFTNQYGWVWLPYGALYTYEPTVEGAYPYSYIYYPTYGWTWVVSPWVWGWGPSPYFGYWGPRYFGWYHGPGWHRPGWGFYAFRGGWFPPRRWLARRQAPLSQLLFPIRLLTLAVRPRVHSVAEGDADSRAGVSDFWHAMLPLPLRASSRHEKIAST